MRTERRRLAWGGAGSVSAWALVAAAIAAGGCGLQSGDILTSERPAYFISPQGSDSNPGTEAAPWLTFAHALPNLRAGLSLVLEDGTYEASTTGYLQILCNGTAHDGAPDHPITVRAKNERRALFLTDGIAVPIYVSACKHWVLEGLRAEGTDAPGAATDLAGSLFVVNNGSDDIVIRRALAAHANRFQQASLFLIQSDSSHVVIEESEAYAFHYVGFHGYHASSLTLRRDYANSRFMPDVARGYVSEFHDEGDAGFLLTASRDSVIENCIAETVGRGFSIEAGQPGGSAHPSARNQIVGSAALDIAAEVFSIESHCAGMRPCTEADRFVTGTRLENDVSWGGSRGFQSLGALQTTLANVTAWSAVDAGIELVRNLENMGLGATGFVTASLAIGNETSIGFHADSQAEWRFDRCDSFGPMQAFAPRDSHVTNATDSDPAMDGCLVYSPPSNRTNGTGPLGANIVTRYVDGKVTGDSLWDPVTGRFPCGAEIPGVNDVTLASASCSAVHTRLHVGVPGCPVP